MKRFLLSVFAILAFTFMANAQNNSEVLFTDGFESGNLDNWTLVDNDGDGSNWGVRTYPPHSGFYMVSSWSWDFIAYNPDNWMITPDVTGATNVQYFVSTNINCPDHYAIMASSTGINLSDFSIVFEEDAPTARGMAHSGEKSSTAEGEIRNQGPWIERNITLPAGTKYVAFRHFNSENQNYLFIDDVTVTGGGSSVNTIGEIHIEGYTAPVYGANPDFDVSVPTGAPYSIVDLAWYGDSYELTPESVFSEGGTYYMYLTLLPETGYEFDENATVYFDGDDSVYDPEASSLTGGFFFVYTIDYYITLTAVPEQEANMLSVYPNPAADKLVFTSEAMVNEYRIYDIAGSEITSDVVNAETFEVNVSDMPAGIYVIRIYGDGIIQSKKFVVK